MSELKQGDPKYFRPEGAKYLGATEAGFEYWYKIDGDVPKIDMYSDNASFIDWHNFAHCLRYCIGICAWNEVQRRGWPTTPEQVRELREVLGYQKTTASPNEITEEMVALANETLDGEYPGVETAWWKLATAVISAREARKQEVSNATGASAEAMRVSSPYSPRSEHDLRPNRNCRTDSSGPDRIDRREADAGSAKRESHRAPSRKNRVPSWAVGVT